LLVAVVDVVDLMLEVVQGLVLAAELVISQYQIHRHKVKHLILELVEKVVMVAMVLDQELVVEEDNPLLDLVDVEVVLDLVVGLVVEAEAVVPLL
jgi:hypothetical protein|tara:strand:+ start:119 stop:403 length:285 start_codon:yes stop_codon:yes gene_type:complete